MADPSDFFLHCNLLLLHQIIRIPSIPQVFNEVSVSKTVIEVRIEFNRRVRSRR